MGWGPRIREARRRAKLNQTQLGELVGAGQPTVAQWEAGKNEPALAMIVKIAEATRSDACWLAFGHSLPEAEAKLLTIYRQMDQRGKRWLEDTVDRELERLGIAALGQE